MDIKNYYSKKIKIAFSEKEKFRILCVSDIHGGKGYDKEYTVKNLTSLLDKTNPDLVLFLGDIAGPGYIHIENAEQLTEMLDGLTKPLEDRKIPWGHVFGNHDDNYGLENKNSQKIYESYPHCVSHHVDGISGSSNYIIPIFDEKGEKILFNVYAFDSHAGSDGFREDYSLTQYKTELTNRGGIDSGERGLDFNQVKWYYDTSVSLEEKEGKKVPSMAVMHVPVQELAWCSLNPSESNYTGYQGEPVSCQYLNSGFFRACTERGDMKAMCFGHDHEINCSAEFCGIILSYDGYLSRHASHTKETFGGRIFDIDKSNPNDVKTEFIGAE